MYMALQMMIYRVKFRKTLGEALNHSFKKIKISKYVIKNSLCICVPF